VQVSFNLTGLTSETTYYYRIVATNSAGTSFGNVVSFTTGTTTTGLVYIGTNTSGYEEYMNTKDSMIVIKIPAGNFTMGSDAGEGATDEEPEHVVYISEYYIGKYEVTNKQYKKFCDATSRSYPSDPGFDGMSSYFTSYPDYPVVMVSWYDAVDYCAWAGLRLPTEAEWEKASRGSADERTYPWGFTEPYYNGQYYCNYDYSDADGYLYTCPVTAFSIGKSPYGCYNMAGNVWEWCNDWYYGSYYSISPSTDPQGPTTGNNKVVRGGSWSDNAGYMRSAFRLYNSPSDMLYGLIGFRCSASE
jgi:formylglycine-generating enzyme required for sulfatase activity